MAVETPSVAEIRDRIVADFEAEFGQVVPLLSRNVLRVLATVYAGAVWLLYKLAQRVSLNLHPATATGTGLDDIGTTFNVARALERAWTGSAELVRALPPAQYTNPAVGTTYRAADGVEYVVTAVADRNAPGVDPAQPNGSVTLSLRAQAPGAAGNRANGDVIEAVVLVPGQNSTATVYATSTAGQDRQTDDAYRERIIDRLQRRPQGGAFNDYIAWARETAGVTRVWPYAEGIGYVRVYFTRDNNTPRIPTAQQLQAVADYINAADRKPIGAQVSVLAPTEIMFDVFVTGYIPNPNTTNAQVKAEIADYLLSREAGGLDSSLNVPVINQEVRQSDISNRVFQFGNYTGITVYLIGNNNASTQTITHQLGEGQLAVLRELRINGTPVA